MNKTALMALLLMSIMLNKVAVAAPGGELDASFGGNGRLTIAQIDGSQGDLLGRDVAQQSDGKLIMGANIAGNQFKFALIRLNPGGGQDLTFGTGGMATVDSAGFLGRVVVQPDDKIIAAGGAADFVLARFNADGTRDATFGDDGLVTLDLGGFEEWIVDVALLPSGRIVVMGTTDARGIFDVYDVAFARFTSAGTLDASFGTGEIAGTTILDSSTRDTYVSALTLQPDGKIVACGSRNQDMLAVRVNDDGSIDTGFGADGISIVTAGASTGATSCVARPDGTILLAGNSGDRLGSDLALARLSAAGELDTSFANNGFSIIDLGGGDHLQAMIAMDDGSLGIAGRTETYDDLTVRDMFFARIDPDSGAIDPDFGHSGWTVVDFGHGNVPSAVDLAGLIRQADGKLLGVGTHSEIVGPWDYGTTAAIIALARVDPAGAGSTGFAGFAGRPGVLVEETSAQLTLTVRRTGGSRGFLSVDYTTVPGTAQSPGDFTETSGTLVWDVGDMAPKTITIPIVNDAVAEPDEEFTVELTNSSGGLSMRQLTVRIQADSATSPPIAPTGGGGGGGGAATIVELLLAVAYACSRRSRCRKRRFLTGPAFANEPKIPA